MALCPVSGSTELSHTLISWGDFSWDDLNTVSKSVILQNEMKAKKTCQRLVIPTSHASGRCSMLVLSQRQLIFYSAKQREP